MHKRHGFRSMAKSLWLIIIFEIHTMKHIILFTTLLFPVVSFSQDTTSSGIRIDSLPESTIDIPIQVNIKPIYVLAEKNVDTIFTSPNYPEGWVNSDCATRYKYHFRRSPLQI